VIVMLSLTGFAVARAQPSVESPVRMQKYAMGTVFEIFAYDTPAGTATKAIDLAFQEVVRLDGVMSNYKPDSELSHLNRDAHFHPRLVSGDLYRVIEQSLKYSRMSAGKFDITVAPLVDLWKAQLRGERTVTPEDEKRARSCVGYEKIRLLPPNQIEFRSPCMRIDLGSIGKGYAIDRAVEILRSHRIERALISAGGSTIYAIGTPPGQNGWSVRLRDPSQQVNPEVVLKNNSVSTSEQTPPSTLENKPAGHVIDPQQGTPLESSFAVSVVAPTATASDALSTTLLLLGPEAGKAVVAEIGESAAAWVSQEGQVQAASNGAVISITESARSGAQLEHASSR
jgi:thiamine biosynthesis lipoprotein